MQKTRLEATNGFMLVLHTSLDRAHPERPKCLGEVGFWKVILTRPFEEIQRIDIFDGSAIFDVLPRR
jgi:hypothetical protein